VRPAAQHCSCTVEGGRRHSISTAALLHAAQREQLQLWAPGELSMCACCRASRLQHAFNSHSGRCLEDLLLHMLGHRVEVQSSLHGRVKASTACFVIMFRHLCSIM
jgi:hypothetical protein